MSSLVHRLLGVLRSSLVGMLGGAAGAMGRTVVAAVMEVRGGSMVGAMGGGVESGMLEGAMRGMEAMRSMGGGTAASFMGRLAGARRTLHLVATTATSIPRQCCWLYTRRSLTVPQLRLLLFAHLLAYCHNVSGWHGGC